MNAAGTHPVVNGVPAPPVELERGGEDAGEADIGALLSPSSATTFLSCSAKWYYRKVLQLPDSQGPSRAIGKAFHATLKENFGQKVETRRDIGLIGVMAIYKDAWLAEERVTTFQKDDDRAELRAMGASLVTKFMETTAPLIEPAAVELAVSGVIGGVDVRGYVDLIDVHGRIIDMKTAKTSPAKGKIRPDHRFQIASYAPITPGASGEAELFHIVKLKREIKIVPQAFTLTEADKRSVEIQYPLVQEGMRSGLVYPNRSSFLCSRRYCPYVDKCISDYGGVVDGETGDD